MGPGAALRPPVAANRDRALAAAAVIPWTTGRCHSSKEQSQALSQRSFLSHLHRDQVLAQLCKGHFLTQDPQRSLKRFLADPWGKEFTAGRMDGTIQQNGTVLHRAVGQDPVGDTGRAHKQGDVREGSPL